MERNQVIDKLLTIYRESHRYGIMVGGGQVIEDLLTDLEIYCREQNLDYKYISDNAKFLNCRFERKE